MAKEVAQSIITRTTKVLKSDKIGVIEGFNVRSGDFTKEVAVEDDVKVKDQGESGWEGFRGSFMQQGQLTPCVVRPLNPKLDEDKTLIKSGFEYALVAGHKRKAAIDSIWAEGSFVPGLPKGHIRCDIAEGMTPADAEIENLLENTGRKGLSKADLAFGLARIQKTTGANSSEISARCNITKGYVDRLLKIMNGVPAKITTAWRAKTDLEGKGRHDISVEDMTAVVNAPHERREEQYGLACGKKAANPDGSTGRMGAGGWIKTAIADAQAMGCTMGLLAHRGLFDMNEDDFDWGAAVSAVLGPVGLKKKGEVTTPADAKQMQQIVGAAIEGYGWGIKGLREAPKAPDAPASKPKNGASANA